MCYSLCVCRLVFFHCASLLVAFSNLILLFKAKASASPSEMQDLLWMVASQVLLGDK